MAEAVDQRNTTDVSGVEKTRKILQPAGVSAANDLFKTTCINYIKPASNKKRYANNSRLQMDIGADKKIAADYTDALEDSTPVYPDVMPISLRDHERLQRIGSDHGLLPIAIMSLPNNGIRLIGKNITHFEREILEVFEESGHARVEVKDNTMEMDGIMYIGPQHFSGEVRRMLLASGRWETDKKVSSEVIAVAHDKITGERVFFSVVPAHLILSKEQCKSMAGVNSNLSHIQSILNQQTPDCKYEYENENQRRCQKLLPQPLLSYGLWDVGNTKRSPESNKSESFEQVFDSLPVMSDMALLKFDEYECDELASKADAFAIPSKCHLDLLSKRQQRVIIGNLEGRLIYGPQCVGNGNEWYGLHLAFTITTKDSNGKTCTLREGDSGLAVFFKGKQDQLIPVGMLVGKFSEEIEDFDSEIYQAIVLSHAFKEIEHGSPGAIGNIRVLETCHRTAALQQLPAEMTIQEKVDETSNLQTVPWMTAAENLLGDLPINRLQYDVQALIQLNQEMSQRLAALLKQQEEKTSQLKRKIDEGTDDSARMTAQYEEHEVLKQQLKQTLDDNASGMRAWWKEQEVLNQQKDRRIDAFVTSGELAHWAGERNHSTRSRLTNDSGMSSSMEIGTTPPMGLPQLISHEPGSSDRLSQSETALDKLK